MAGNDVIFGLDDHDVLVGDDDGIDVTVLLDKHADRHPETDKLQRFVNLPTTTTP